ncbi:MAG: hypothetical protein QF913_03345 [Nitrospinaceae bacterium]|nr:hypothetical protein [Nitrospinaceae bacterium]
MKIVVRLLALVVMIAFVGCTTTGGGSSSSGGSGAKLSDADFKKIGVAETYDKRN